MNSSGNSKPNELFERERMASLFAQAPTSMAMIMGPSHVFEFTNDRYLELVGHRELIGKTVAEGLPEVASQGILELLDQVYRSGKRFEAREMPIQLKEPGSSALKDYFLDFTYEPLRDSKGEVVGIMAVVNDVTTQVLSRKYLEIERQNFYTFFDETREIVSILSGPEHIYEYVNAAHIEIVGKDLTGLKLIEARPESADIVKIMDEVYQSGKTARLSEIPIRIGGEERFMSFTFVARRSASGEVNGILALGSDLTNQVKTRNRLEKEKELEALKRGLFEVQQTWLEQILNRVPSVVLLMEPVTGKTLFANEAAKKFYGLDSVAKGTSNRFKNFKTLSDGEGNPLAWDQAPSARAARGEKFRDVEVIVGSDEGEQYLLAHSDILPGISHQGASIFIFAQDITDIRKAEKAGRDAALQVEAERQKLNQVFAQAPVGISIVSGPEHIFELVNENYKKMIPNQRDYLGRRYADVFPEAAGQGLVELLNGIYKSGQTYHGVAVPVTITGDGGVSHLRHYDFIIQPLFEADGSVKRLLSVVLDVSVQVASRAAVEIQQQKTRESEARFRQLADSMPQIVWTARPDGVLNYTNQRWTEYSGSSDPEAWLTFVHPDDTTKAVADWTHSVTTGENYETEFRLHDNKGRYRWHLVRAVQILDSIGNVANWFGTCTDIQDQKEAKASAEAANSAKTAFLANMSHEIRTPLGAILGFTGLLRSSDLMGEEEKKYLDVIVRSGQNLTRVIDDILDISKIEAGKLDIEKIAFSPLQVANEVIGLFNEKAKEKNISLTLKVNSSLPAEIISDPARLRQILINIVGNAVKFTEKGGVELSVKARELGERQVALVILVKDSGVGLEPAQVEKLFQPFTQAESGTNRKFGGTGLGLVISLKLAQALGGNLRLSETRAGGGCTFEIEIKAQLPEVKTNPAPAENQFKATKNVSRLKGLRILGVDDSSDNRMLMEIFLRREGADYEEAESGESALAQIKNGNFDVILMDIQMPGLDGYEVVRILREGGYKKPIIALTAHAMAEERQRTLSSGFDQHVTKPIDPDLLVAAILEQLKA